MPSCMRAPPDALTTTSGTRRSAARSQQRASFSPTTLPMLPPRKPKSIDATTQGWRPIVRSAAIMASVPPAASAFSTRFL